MTAFELNPLRQRPSVETAQPRLVVGGNQSVKTVRPSTTDPIPVRTSSPKMGTIIIRFVGLLVVAVALLAFFWSR
jgi:hypothetical protein